MHPYAHQSHQYRQYQQVPIMAHNVMLTQNQQPAPQQRMDAMDPAQSQQNPQIQQQPQQQQNPQIQQQGQQAVMQNGNQMMNVNVNQNVVNQMANGQPQPIQGNTMENGSAPNGQMNQPQHPQLAQHQQPQMQQAQMAQAQVQPNQQTQQTQQLQQLQHQQNQHGQQSQQQAMQSMLQQQGQVIQQRQSQQMQAQQQMQNPQQMVAQQQMQAQRAQQMQSAVPNQGSAQGMQQMGAMPNGTVPNQQPQAQRQQMNVQQLMMQYQRYAGEMSKMQQMMQANPAYKTNPQFVTRYQQFHQTLLRIQQQIQRLQQIGQQQQQQQQQQQSSSMMMARRIQSQTQTQPTTNGDTQSQSQQQLQSQATSTSQPNEQPTQTTAPQGAPSSAAPNTLNASNAPNASSSAANKLDFSSLNFGSISIDKLPDFSAYLNSQSAAASNSNQNQTASAPNQGQVPSQQDANGTAGNAQAPDPGGNSNGNGNCNGSNNGDMDLRRIPKRQYHSPRSNGSRGHSQFAPNSNAQNEPQNQNQPNQGGQGQVQQPQTQQQHADHQQAPNTQPTQFQQTPGGPGSFQQTPDGHSQPQQPQQQQSQPQVPSQPQPQSQPQAPVQTQKTPGGPTTGGFTLSLPNLNQSEFPKQSVPEPRQEPVNSNLSPNQQHLQQAQSQQSSDPQQNQTASAVPNQTTGGTLDQQIAKIETEINQGQVQYKTARESYGKIDQFIRTQSQSYKASLQRSIYTSLIQQYGNQIGQEQLMLSVNTATEQRFKRDMAAWQEKLNKERMICEGVVQRQQQLSKTLQALQNQKTQHADALKQEQQRRQAMAATNARNMYRQSPAMPPQEANPWQKIISSGVDEVPQWVQCAACRKWRVMNVPTANIATWVEPTKWTCSQNKAPNNYCGAAQEKPDQSQYTALQLSALSVQRQLKIQRQQVMKQRQKAGHTPNPRNGGQAELTKRMIKFRQQQQYQNTNNQLFGNLCALMDMKERKEQEEKFEELRKQKEAEKAALRAKQKEKEATRKLKKKRLNRDSDDEYLPDPDESSSDEEYNSSDDKMDDEDDHVMFNREAMRRRHQAPSAFNFNMLCSNQWTLPEIMSLVSLAAECDQNFTHEILAQHPVLMQRHSNPEECAQKLAEIMKKAEEVQNPQRSMQSSGASSNAGGGRGGGKRSKSVDDSDDEEFDGRKYTADATWTGGRKSSRLAGRPRKTVDYSEDTAIDRYLAREEAEVVKSQKAADEIYEEKIETILQEKVVFVAPKSQLVYDDIQHALDHGCKASELLEQTRYFFKIVDVSYLHCEWATEQAMIHRFGKLRVQRKIASWNRKKEDYENKCALLWGGEPFDPAFAEVDRIIDCIEVDGVEGNKKYYVKWMGLSYSNCTYETKDDVDDEDKIAQFERWNTIPSDTATKCMDDASFKKGMYGWYKLTADGGKAQPAQNEADARMKQELAAAGVKPDDPMTYKGGNRLRDYQVIGVNWLIQKFYEGSNSILADEMGLGKTVQSVTFIEHLHRVNNIHGPFLIVAPLSTLFHWKREIESWTDLNCVVYHDSDRGQLSREKMRNHEFFYSGSKRKTPKFNILLTTYEIVMTDLEWLANIKWFLCVVDEGHRLKSRSTQLTKSFEMMDCERRILLTGTPIQNSMDELFNLLHFLEPKEFVSFRDFNRSYGTTQHGDGSLRDASQLGSLQQRIQQYILRRLKENVEKSIPTKEETIIDIELTTIQKTYYRALFDRNREFLEAGVDKGNLPNLINLEVQLRKCCNHPWLIDGTIDRECGQSLSHSEYMEKTIAASGKMVLLDKLLPKLQREGHRVLIFSQMRKVLNILEEYLEYKAYKYERFDGTTSSHDRQAAIDRFSAPNSDRLVFLLTTRAGGVGLNLVAADTVIIFDSDWNPQQDIQAQARCHRIGQKKAVGVYRLVTKNTYEAQMFERASRKLGLGQAILKSVEHGVKKKDVQDLKQLDNMLRHGAYAILTDDDEAAKKWQECDIDELLQHASHKVEHRGKDEKQAKGIGMHSFTRKTFESDKAKDTASLDVTGANFWNDLWKIRQNKSKGKDHDDDLYLDNYLLDDKTRAERLLNSLTALKEAAEKRAKNEKEKEKDEVDSDDEDEEMDQMRKIKLFANDKKRDKWFKRYKLHMEKMVQLKESPQDDVPCLELQITLSELVTGLQVHFSKKHRRNINEWNSKLTQRSRRKTKKSLNEDALSQPHLYAFDGTKRSSRRKRKRDDDLDYGDEMDRDAKRMSSLSNDNDDDEGEEYVADDEFESPPRKKKKGSSLKSSRSKSKKSKKSKSSSKKSKRSKSKENTLENSKSEKSSKSSSERKHKRSRSRRKHKKRSRSGRTKDAGDGTKVDKIWAFDFPTYAFDWDDRCDICNGGGELILCEGPCVGSFHVKCLGLECAPTEDPWYCKECKALRKKREEIHQETGGKSSRFRPKTYTIKVWMDRNNDDVDDVYCVKTAGVLEAKCFYPSSKRSKSKSKSRKSKRSRKRTHSQMDTDHGPDVQDDDPKDEDYRIGSEMDKPPKKRHRKGSSSSSKKKSKSKSKSRSKSKVKVEKESNGLFEDSRMTRSQKKNLVKMLKETKGEVAVKTEKASKDQQLAMEEKTEEMDTKQDRTKQDEHESPQEDEVPIHHEQEQLQQQQQSNGGQPKMQFDFSTLGNMMKMNFAAQNQVQQQQQQQQTPTNIQQQVTSNNIGNIQMSPRNQQVLLSNVGAANTLNGVNLGGMVNMNNVAALNGVNIARNTNQSQAQAQALYLNQRLFNLGQQHYGNQLSQGQNPNQIQGGNPNATAAGNSNTTIINNITNIHNINNAANLNRSGMQTHFGANHRMQ